MDHLGISGVIILGVAAFLAGGINAVAGGGSLITFPSLIAFGFAPVTANVTNTVALVPGYIGGIAGYRRELEGQSKTIRTLLPAVFAGAVIGSVILLTTSADIFRILVPVLVLAAALLLLFQPMIQKRMTATHPETGEPISGKPSRYTIASVFLSAIYGAYFGGVLGIVLLAVLGISLIDSLQRLNALKSVLQFSINIVAVIIFALFGPVQWWVVAFMSPLTLAGGWLGSHFARGLNPLVLRRVIGIYGICCAIALAVFLR